MASIFISHSHSDQSLAESLVDCLLSALDVLPASVLCTSVPGHQLTFGKTIAEQLKSNIHDSSAVLILLTMEALKSKWVMFELGASWALGKVVVPILGAGVGSDSLPGPLAAYPSVAVDSTDASSRMADAIAQIASQINLTERTGGKRESRLQSFLDRARAQRTSPLPPSTAMAMAFEIPWIIRLVVSGQAKHPAARIAQVRYYVSQLRLEMDKPIESYLRTDDEGRGATELIARLRGSLAVQNQELIAVFEAGANLLQLAVSGKEHELLAEVMRLPLPESLKTPRDRFGWLSEIHEYLVGDLHKVGRS